MPGVNALEEERIECDEEKDEEKSVSYSNYDGDTLFRNRNYKQQNENRHKTPPYEPHYSLDLRKNGRGPTQGPK